MTVMNETLHSKDKLWRHSFANAVYGLSQGFEGACRPKPDLEASRILYDLSLQKIQDLFEEVLKAAAEAAPADLSPKPESKA